MQGRAVDPDPDRVTLYAGICEGGPHHGRNLYHGLPEMEISRSKLSGKYVTWFGSETAEIEILHYRHQDGRWVWHDKEGK